MLNPIREFIELWKQETKKYYITISDKYKEAKKVYEDMPVSKERRNLFETTEKNFVRLYGMGTMQIVKYSMWKIDEVIEKDGENRYKKFIKKIEEKAGKNINFAQLHMAENFEINGFVKGDIGTAEVRTIIAGGYNVQCLHYRVIIN